MLKKRLEKFAQLSCEWRYGRRLSAYLDNELSVPEARTITGHLRGCARCRVEFEQLRFANRALGEYEIPPMRNPVMGGHVFQLPVLKEVSPLTRICSKKIAVPLPLAAGVAIAVVATLFARGWSLPATPGQTSVPGPASVPAVIKVVEVPVDRVVVRTVYSKRSGSRRVRGNGKGNQFTLTPPYSKRDIAQNEGQTVEWSDSTLKDFRPAASANLRVVKEK